MRCEHDSLGEKTIDINSLYGIHSLRARENFPLNEAFIEEWYKAMGITKLACYQSYRKFANAALKQSDMQNLNLRFISPDVLEALEIASTEVSEGSYFEHFIVPALQGGAGTSINMNVNEIIANAALLHLGFKPGNYKKIDPVEDANIYQSTNDVVPTALKVAAMKLFIELESCINDLRFSIEELEKRSRHFIRTGFTQMQEAVPSSYGLLFSTYSEALSRDWWRVSKCLERIKVVNLGGGAIGTGMGIPRFYLMDVVSNLQRLTNLPLTRSENLPDATSNLDSLVEVHAILKAHAVNLEKMVSDIRLLASDIGPAEITIPKKQVGSSIMPGKINPVIVEFAISAAHQVYANDQLITGLSAQGCLELNPYLPSIGNAMLKSIKILIAVNKSLRKNLFEGLSFSSDKAAQRLWKSPSITTALAPVIGYHKASQLAFEMRNRNCDIFEANQHLAIFTDDEIHSILAPQNLLKMGFSLVDVTAKKNES